MAAAAVEADHCTTLGASLQPGIHGDGTSDRVVFWGAGVNPQATLAFGTPDEVRAEVREHLRIFAPGGGFVFAGVHNLQPMVPTENLLAMYEAFAETRTYPVGG